MHQSSCPNCGAGYKPQTLGRLQDKVLQCAYCGHTIDIPDEYEVSREEIIHDRPGTTRKVIVTERRSDIAGKDFPFPETFIDGSFSPEVFFERLKEEGHIPADAEFSPDENGNFEYHTSTENLTTHTSKALGKSMEKLQEIMGEEFDPFGSLKGKIPSTGPGKNFTRTVTRELKTSSSPGKREIRHSESNAADTTSLVKWLVVLAGIVLMIILAVKFL